MHKYYTLALPAFAALANAACNPIKNTTCTPNVGLTSSTYSVDFTAGADTENWESVGGGNVSYTSSGAEFTISAKGDSPTLQTSWYMFFGRVEVHMKAAPGTGIVSSIVLLSDDFDEVDWEWIGGENDEVQTNYFGKGVSTSSGRSSTESVDDVQGTSHNYTLYWTKEELSWYLDGSLLRTVTYDQAANGDEFPQTPSRVKLGIWAGGDSDNAAGTISWAGGETDYDNGPYTMTVESVDVTNFNPAGTYTWSDQSGDYSSIVLGEASDDDSDSTTTTTAAAQSSATSAVQHSTTSAAQYSTVVTSIVPTTVAPTTIATQVSSTVEYPVATESSTTGSGDNSGDGSDDGSDNDGSDNDGSDNDGSDNDGSDDGSDDDNSDDGSDNDNSGDNDNDNSGDNDNDDDNDCDCDNNSNYGWHSRHRYGSWSKHSYGSWGKHSHHGGHGHWGKYSGGGKFRNSKFGKGSYGSKWHHGGHN